MGCGPLGYRRKRRIGHDLTGQRFGRLTALRQDGQDKWQSYMWLCQCDCGAQSRVRTFKLRGGTVRSCGCANPRMFRGRRKAVTAA